MQTTNSLISSSLRLLLSIFIFLLLPSCSKDEDFRKRIVGTWRAETKDAVIHFSFEKGGELTARVQEKGAMGVLGGVRNVVFGDYRGTWSINDEALTMEFLGVTDQAGDVFAKLVFTFADSNFNKPMKIGISKLQGGLLVLRNGYKMSKVKG